MPGDRDRLEAGVNSERVEQMPDVVAHRLETQMELPGDLLRRMAPLQQAQHLRLPRRQVRGHRPVGLGVDVDELAEDADDLAAE